MSAKTPLILTLILSLLFVTQARPIVVPAEMKHGGGCAAMECNRGCCANPVCCLLNEQQKTPQAPASAAQNSHVQLAAMELRTYTILFILPPQHHPILILDETSDAHQLTPFAANCIWLI